jgi:hypothetical protein
MKFALVNNISRRGAATDYEVHRGDCADLEKIEAYNVEWVEAKTANDVVEHGYKLSVKEGFDRESAEMFTYDIKPCCKGLRRGSRRDDD